MMTLCGGAGRAQLGKRPGAARGKPGRVGQTPDAREPRRGQDREQELGALLPLVSVVVPTHRRPDLLRRCLRALARQSYPRERVEVVVVEDGGPGSGREVVAQLRAEERLPLAIRYLCAPRCGPAAARNAGWRAARGPRVAFTDDDTVPHPRWIAEGVRSFAQGADAVSGRTLVPISRCPTDWERNVKRLESGTFTTCNAFCRRDLLEAVGGFDPRFRVAYREDSDLEFSLLKAGARSVRNQAAIV
jgi:glycosyltransferase involved in cell wall biosynthesis